MVIELEFPTEMKFPFNNHSENYFGNGIFSDCEYFKFEPEDLVDGRFRLSSHSFFHIQIYTLPI